MTKKSKGFSVWRKLFCLCCGSFADLLMDKNGRVICRDCMNDEFDGASEGETDED
jgi:hypothetical protein